MGNGKGFRAWSIILFVAILALGAWGRFYQLDEKSLWSDEIATIATTYGHSIDPDAHRLRGRTFDPANPVMAKTYVAKAYTDTETPSPAKTAEVLKWNVHPPLFFMLLQPWLAWQGVSPESLRFPVAVFGVMSLVWMYRIARQLARWKPDWRPWQAEAFSLLAMALLAISAYQIDHAQDARPYILLLLLALMTVERMLAIIQCFQKTERILPWQWLILAVLLSAGLMTQYFFLIFAGFVVLTLAWTGRKQPSFLLQLAGTALLSFLFILPWLPFFGEQAVFLKQAGHYTAGLWNPVRLPEKLWRSTCEFFLPDSKIGKLVPLSIGLSALIARRLKHAESSEKRPWSKVSLLLLAWLFVVVGGQVTLDLLKDSHTAIIRRYLLLASPACALLLAYALVSITQVRAIWSRWLAGGLTVLMLSLMAGDSLERLGWRHTASDEFKQAAAWINRHARDTDLVLVNRSGAVVVGMAYYLRPNTWMWGVDIPKSALSPQKTAIIHGLKPVVEKHARVWLVFSHAAPSIIRRLSRWMQGQGFVLKAQEKFPGVENMLWEQGGTPI